MSLTSNRYRDSSNVLMVDVVQPRISVIIVKPRHRTVSLQHKHSYSVMVQLCTVSMQHTYNAVMMIQLCNAEKNTLILVQL